MAGVVDRFTPSDPYPRVLVAFALSSVTLTLFLFGAVVVLNSLRPTETVQGVPGLTLVALFVAMLLGTHAAHTLVRDVADRAADSGEGAGAQTRTRSRETATSSDERSGTTPSDAGTSADAGTDPETLLRRRYADGDVSDEEFERRLDTLRRSKSATEEPDRAVE